jgi:zinc-ribbon domain
LTTEALVCPSCGERHAGGESFCASCGMPLVRDGGEPLEAPLSEAHGRARKIDPAYTEGPLVLVAGGRHQAEAELIQGLLLEEGVPSVVRRSAGADVPDFLAAGPRDVLVPEAGAQAAHDVLLQTELAPREGPALKRPHAGKLTAVVVGAGGLATLVAWLLQRAAA